MAVPGLGAVEVEEASKRELKRGVGKRHEWELGTGTGICPQKDMNIRCSGFFEQEF